MSDIVIRADKLGKKYILGRQVTNNDRYIALRDVWGEQFRQLLKNATALIHRHHSDAANKVQEFWALKDISFEIRRGEVVGIIGRNGAGKSTLLKIISRITEPTNGRVEIRGRIASLLEVGTGFHPELTGRENIYLNGAILGMSRIEIKSKFDEIVTFAGVETFLDTPVKRYSSGMYVRLAFAVAAHLEPEILVVDEVLAVGDAEFQKKCLGKMHDVASAGRTVLFVSHNMGAIERLTKRSILLNAGRVDFVGSTEIAISKYLSKSDATSGEWRDVSNTPRNYGNGKVRAQSARSYYSQNTPASAPTVTLDVVAEIIQPVPSIRISFTIFKDGMPIGSGFSDEVAIATDTLGNLDISAVISNTYLSPGIYSVGFSLGSGNATTGQTDYDVVLDGVSFEVTMTYISGNPLITWPSKWGALVFNDVLIDKCVVTRNVMSSRNAI